MPKLAYMLLPLLVIILCILLPIYFGYRTDNISNNIIIEYKSVESTGLYGAAQYYLFDKDGNRYRVTQQEFDKRHVERK